MTQAVEMAGYNASVGDGCTSTWFVFIPGSEGSNETTELQFYWSHSTSFVGIFMDDYFGQDDAVYQNLTSHHVNVCPVIYNFLSTGVGVTGASCVILAIGPGSPSYTAARWSSLMENETAEVGARNVHILVYSSFTRNGISVTVTDAYLQGAVSASVKSGEFLVVWH
jgi:hypothetical protein